MRRAVLDPGVFVSALLNLTDTPALLRKKFRRYATVEEVADYLAFIRRLATVAPDPDKPAPLSGPDPKDDYLLALAYAQKAVLVSGDSDLLEIVSGAPILAPADYLAR
jgi:predicted nucleic acid-binding protein